MKTVSENQNKDKKRRMNSFIKENRQWFILLGAIFLFLVLLVVIVWYSGTQKKWNPGTDTFRYIMGVKVEYSPDMKLVHTDGGTMIEDKDSVYSDGTPIVNAEEAQLILPVSMGLMRPFHEDSLKRVNYFSTLNKEGNVIEIGVHEYDENGNISTAETIALSASGYSINLGTGVMTVGDTDRILFSDIEAMGVLK